MLKFGSIVFICLLMTAFYGTGICSFWLLHFGFFTVYCYTELGIAIASRPSVCLSICLSVMLRYRGYLGWNNFVAD